MTASVIDNKEKQRLQALWDLEILDTPTDPTFENLTQIAKSLFDVPIVLISLVDKNRQWFKSHLGIDVCELDLNGAFCPHAIQANELFIIEDAQLDARFKRSVLVTGEPYIRFYAGAPLHTECGLTIGTLCIIDTKPRQLSAADQQRLQLLANQVEQLIYLHFRTKELANQTKKSTTTNARYAAIIEGAAAGIVRINGHGIILQMNNSALTMTGYEREELIGQNVKKLMPARWGDHHDGYLSAYQSTGKKRIIGTGREVEALHKDGTHIPVHLAVSEVLYDDKRVSPETREFIGILSDLRAVAAARAREAKERALLAVLHQGLTDYHALLSGNTLWIFLKEALKNLTNSEYALIGEVIHKNNAPALKIHAISDLSWSSSSRKLMRKLRKGEMLLTSPHNMLGQVFAAGQVILTNNLSKDPRGGALPEGHPVLSRYLGVPIIDRGEVIGMYAIANANQDYDDELVQWLKPFTSTCALLINLYRQLNEQKRFTEELKIARDLAEQSSQAKTDFLSSMSHELRTPLNAILGFAQLLSNSKQGLSERQQRQTNQILRSGNHLLTLINEVLDLARIESGHTQVSLESVNLIEVINESLEIIHSLSAAQQLHTEVIIDKSQHHFVEADYTRLKQILINLLSNAVKYNRPQGRIFLRCEAKENRMHISVTDTGRGIDSSQINDLFEPFNRLGAENSSIEGAGVGLALTRKLAKLMHTDITVESTIGEGSCFSFSLPIVNNQPLSPETDSTTTSPAATELTLNPNYQVLYIEDNPENQRLMQEICNELPDVKLQCVNNAEEGFELACSQAPHLILMDIDLPGMNGFQAKRLLQQNPLTSHIPVLAISACSTPSELQQAKDLGFIDFYTKPFNLDIVAQHIKKILLSQETP